MDTKYVSVGAQIFFDFFNRQILLILRLFGVALFANYFEIYLLAAVMTPLINVLAGFEEKELIERYGKVYQEYASQTPRFIPRLFSSAYIRPNKEINSRVNE